MKRACSPPTHVVVQRASPWETFENFNSVANGNLRPLKKLRGVLEHPTWVRLCLDYRTVLVVSSIKRCLERVGLLDRGLQRLLLSTSC